MVLASESTSKETAAAKKQARKQAKAEANNGVKQIGATPGAGTGKQHKTEPTRGNKRTPQKRPVVDADSGELMAAPRTGGVAGSGVTAKPKKDKKKDKKKTKSKSKRYPGSGQNTSTKRTEQRSRS